MKFSIFCSEKYFFFIFIVDTITDVPILPFAHVYPPPTPPFLSHHHTLFFLFSMSCFALFGDPKKWNFWGLQEVEFFCTYPSHVTVFILPGQEESLPSPAASVKSPQTKDPIFQLEFVGLCSIGASQFRLKFGN